MICKTCGKELNVDDKFCSRCGSKVEVATSPYEEVVFNPPFKLEQQKAAEEMMPVEEPKKANKFDTIDFSWDLSGFPTGEGNKRKEVEEVAFDWNFPPRKPSSFTTANDQPKEETAQQVTEPVIEEVVQAEEPKVEEPKVIEPKVEEPKPEEPEVEEPKVEEIKPEEPKPIIEETFEDGMPKGNGISVEDFLDELKNHVPREEREKREEPGEEEGEKNIAEQFTSKMNEGRKGLVSFFKGTFGEPKDEEEELVGELAEEEPIQEEVSQVIEEEPVQEEAPEIVEEPVEEKELAEELAEEEPAEEEVAEETPFEEINVEDKTISTLMNQEINDFLPEDQQETEASDETLEATRIVDKFYTFNKKNVEFQQLLDQEYEKIRGDKPIEQVKAEIKQSNMEAGQMARDVLEMKEAGKLEQASRPNWDEIFGEDHEEEPKKKTKAGKVIGILILIIAIIAGGSWAVVKYMPNSEAASFIENIYDKGMALINGSEEKQADTASVQGYINKVTDKNTKIAKIKYDSSLKFDSEKDYGVKGIEKSKEFIDSAMKDKAGNDSTVGEIITSKIIKSYSAKVTAEKSKTIDELRIGDYRSSEDGFYALTSYDITDSMQGSTETCNEIVFLTFKDNQIVIKSIGRI